MTGSAPLRTKTLDKVFDTGIGLFHLTPAGCLSTVGVHHEGVALRDLFPFLSLPLEPEGIEIGGRKGYDRVGYVSQHPGRTALPKQWTSTLRPKSLTAWSASAKSVSPLTRMAAS